MKSALFTTTRKGGTYEPVRLVPANGTEHLRIDKQTFDYATLDHADDGSVTLQYTDEHGNDIRPG
jgi:hypothetical protein